MAGQSPEAFRVVRLETDEERSRPRLTGRGAAVLAAGLMMILAGLLTRDGDLTALGVGAVLLLGPMACLAWWNLRSIELAASVPEKVVAEERFDCVLRVNNGRPLGDAFQIFAEQQLPGGGMLHFHAPWTPARGESEVQLDGSVPRRGVFGGSAVALRSAFPFGLFRCQARGQLSERMLVMPRPLIPKALQDPCLANDTEEMEAEPVKWAGQGELHGLRAYQAGDALRLIHWPASARGLGLMTREFDRPRLQPLIAVVVFHSSSSSRCLIKPQDFESALRLLAGAVWRLRQQGIALEIRADFLGWRAFRCSNDEETRQFHSHLAKVKRARETTLEETRKVVRATQEQAMLVIIGDLPMAGWATELGKTAGARRTHVFDPGHIGGAKPLRLPPRKGGRS
ncbi:MAG: DUF58 domain-containing protein [Verrucomicrobiales bacterium]